MVSSIPTNTNNLHINIWLQATIPIQIITIICLHIAIPFQAFLSNTNNFYIDLFEYRREPNRYNDFRSVWP